MGTEAKKILWIMNTPLPGIMDQLGIQNHHKEGWLAGLYGAVCEYAPELVGSIKLAFPMNADLLKQKLTYHQNGYGTYCVNDAEYYAFPEDTAHPEVRSDNLEQILSELFEEVKPDLIHVFGTEYWHSTAAALAAEEKYPVLVSMQGVVDACTKHYMCYLKESDVHRRTFRDWLKHDSLEQQQAKFRVRAGFERETLERVRHVAGRTSFDHDEVLKINQNLTYHHLGEVLRKPFYETGERKPVPHSIFISQGNYPLKGAHLVLEALPIIIRKYPDATLTIAGDDLTRNRTWKEKVKISGYGKLLRRLIRENDLAGHVHFTGSVDAEEMKQLYLGAEVFVCPSSVENSPNSVGEAMLQKTPVVASETGGIVDVIEPDTEACFFTPGNIEELAERVLYVMDNPGEASMRAERAFSHACREYDPKRIVDELLNVYTSCMDAPCVPEE